MRTSLFILILASLFAHPMLAQQLDSTVELEEQVQLAKTDAQKVDAICNLARHQYNVHYDIKCFDSLSLSAIDFAKRSLDRKLELEAKIQYLQSIGQEYSHKSLQEIISSADRIALEIGDKKLKIRTWLAIANAYANSYNVAGDNQNQLAFNFSSKANNAALNSDIETQIAAGLSLGKTSLLVGDILGSFSSYMNARFQIAQLEYPAKNKYSELLHEHLYKFFYKTKNFQKAIDSKKNLIALLDSSSSEYEEKLKWHEYHIAYTRNKINQHTDITNEIVSLLDYTKESQNKRLEDHALALYRKYLIDNNDFKTLKEKFTNEYSEYFENLKQEKVELQVPYYMTKAYFFEHDGLLDSSFFYFNLAGNIINPANLSHRLANYCIRYGNLLSRNKLQDQAIAKYKQGLHVSMQLDYKPFIETASQNLESLYADLLMMDSAYHYSIIRQEASQKLTHSSLKTDILILEIQTERKIELYKKGEKEEEKKRKTKLQYTGIIIAVLLISVFLILISSFAVPKWVIKMLGFFNILLVFEFITLIIDAELHHRTHGNQLPIYLSKVALLSILFPLHHYIELVVVKYMLEHNLIRRPSSKSIRQFFHKLWPWLAEDKEEP